jgi:hypothetical protein
MLGLPVLSVLTIGIFHTELALYDFLNLYEAYLHAPNPKKKRKKVVDNLPRYGS